MSRAIAILLLCGVGALAQNTAGLGGAASSIPSITEVLADPTYGPVISQVLQVAACVGDTALTTIDPSKCPGLAGVVNNGTGSALACSYACATELAKLSSACTSGLLAQLNKTASLAKPAQTFFANCQASLKAGPPAAAPAPAPAVATEAAPAPAPVASPPSTVTLPVATPPATTSTQSTSGASGLVASGSLLLAGAAAAVLLL